MTQPQQNQNEKIASQIQIASLIIEVRHLTERIDRFIGDAERARREDREVVEKSRIEDRDLIERARIEDRAVIQAALEALKASSVDHDYRIRDTELRQREHSTKLTIFSFLAAGFSVVSSGIGAAIAYALSKLNP